MKIYSKYIELINMISVNKWLTALLFGLTLTFNFLIFPFVIPENEPQILDSRYSYNSQDITDYLSQLTREQKTNSAVIHLSVDIIYPVIYSLLLSTLLFIPGRRLKTKLCLFPLFIFATDIIENIEIVKYNND